MHPTLALLERHSDDFAGANVHWFDTPEDNHPLILEQHKQYNLNWSLRNNATLDQDLWPCSDLNILFYPKAKERLNWWLNQLLPSLSDSKKLWIVGENNGGIKSLPKRLKGVFECVKIDSARHCALFELIPLQKTPLPLVESNFVQDGRTICSLPGVFSAGKLDKGTDVLLKVLPEIRGTVLEFGGGSGVLTAALASMSDVKQVTALEIDLLAVRSSHKTLSDNGLSAKATTLWSAGTAALAEQTFNNIVTNPPFHAGIKTAYGATESFFAEAKKWLKPRGKLIWVANDFLDYQQLLKDDFSQITLLANERGFKVFQAIKN